MRRIIRRSTQDAVEAVTCQPDEEADAGTGTTIEMTPDETTAGAETASLLASYEADECTAWGAGVTIALLLLLVGLSVWDGREKWKARWASRCRRGGQTINEPGGPPADNEVSFFMEPQPNASSSRLG